MVFCLGLKPVLLEIRKSDHVANIPCYGRPLLPLLHSSAQEIYLSTVLINVLSRFKEIDSRIEFENKQCVYRSVNRLDMNFGRIMEVEGNWRK